MNTTPPPTAMRPRVLIADDDLVSRVLLEVTLLDLGYEVITASDGAEALDVLDSDTGPTLAILDWEMPRVSGPDVCRVLRAKRPNRPWYLLLLGVRARTNDTVQGLRAGANDHITKPFDRDELAARLAVASNVIALQMALTTRVRELEHALAHIKTLRGLLPICAWCKKIRDDGDYWRQVEDYVACHTEASFTHGICPTCEERFEEDARGYVRSPRGG